MAGGRPLRFEGSQRCSGCRDAGSNIVGWRNGVKDAGDGKAPEHEVAGFVREQLWRGKGTANGFDAQWHDWAFLFRSPCPQRRHCDSEGREGERRGCLGEEDGGEREDGEWGGGQVEGAGAGEAREEQVGGKEGDDHKGEAAGDAVVGPAGGQEAGVGEEPLRGSG